MADEKSKAATDMDALLEDVPTRFEGGESVWGVPLPKIVTEPFKEPPPISPDMAAILEEARPTARQRLVQGAIGTAQGAARDAPVVYGGVAGARIGLAVAPFAAPFLGPFTPVVPAATTLLGLGVGYLSGQELDSLFPAVPREDLIPYREGGKTFGSAISSAPAAFSLPQITANRVGRFVSTLGEMARRNPKTFMAGEAITAATMGMAGGASESYFPGQEGTRMAAEIGTGLLTPTKLLLSGVDLAKTGLRQARSAYGNRASTLEAKATNILLDALDKSGEDPQALIKALRQQLPGGVPSPTSGQKTGSQALMDLEAALGEHHAQFGGETRQQAQNAMMAYQALIDRLQKIGNPESLRIAAQLREQNFTNMLNARLSAADAKAAQKIAAITKDTPQARAVIGDIVKTETELALQQARTVESELWTEALNRMTTPTTKMTQQKVPMEGIEAQRIFDRTRKWPMITINQPRLAVPSLKPSNTADIFVNRAAQVGEALYDDAIPAPVRKIMEAFNVDQGTVQRFKTGKLTQEFIDTREVPGSFRPSVKEVDVGELVNYRSTLLKMAREAAGKGDISNADFYGALAEGMLKDLESLKDPMFDQARQFSKALNDTFTRTFAKTASITGDVTRTGAERLAPELLVTRAFGRNADVTAQRMEQIEDAVKFMRTQYDDAVQKFGKNSQQAKYLKPLAELADQQVTSVQDAQNRVLRLLAGEAIETVYDQAKGIYVQKLNTAKLTRFTQQNYGMLEKLGIVDDLRDAAHAQNLLTQVTKENSAINQAAKKQSAFAQVLAVESPGRALVDALNSKFPVKNIAGIAKLARAGGRDAVDGMKSALYDYAYTKAGGNSGRFSIQAYEDALFKPISQNQPSLINIMRANGLMTLTEVKDIKRLINPMVRIETAVKNNIPLDDVIQGAGAVSDLALRVIGSHVGTAAAPSGPGSLIAASAGSKAVRQIFDNLPNATVRQILENAVKDPQAMAILLAKGRTEKQQIDIANRLLDYLGSIGVSVGRQAVTPALNYIGKEEPRPPQVQAPFTPQGIAARQLRMLPKAPNSRGVPGLTDKKPGATPQGPSAPPAMPGQPGAKSMFQSLFPNDAIGGMLSQQQG
jgi:hypothetical protein